MIKKQKLGFLNPSLFVLTCSRKKDKIYKKYVGVKMSILIIIVIAFLILAGYSALGGETSDCFSSCGCCLLLPGILIFLGILFLILEIFH